MLGAHLPLQLKLWLQISRYPFKGKNKIAKIFGIVKLASTCFLCSYPAKEFTVEDLYS